MSSATPHLLLDGIDEPGLNTLPVYERRGGYDVMKDALRRPQDGIIEELKQSGLRGRGGAELPPRHEGVVHPPPAGWTSTSSATPTSRSRAPSRIARSCRSARTASSRAW